MPFWNLHINLMLQISIQKGIVNVYYFPLQVFNKHSSHHNSECDIINHWGVIVCKLLTRDLAETFCHKSGMVHTIPFHLKYPSTPSQSMVIWMVSSFHMSPHTHVQHLLELQANSLSPFFSGYQIRVPPSFLETLWLIRIWHCVCHKSYFL